MMSLLEAISPTSAALLAHADTVQKHTMPKKALSVRQPWAWLIVNGYKDIENRSRNSHYRGDLLIHASATMTREDYQSCLLFLNAFFPNRGFRLPMGWKLKEQCGGIVGQVTMTDCVTRSRSKWYTGDYGYTFTQPQELPFRSCKGRLGFFIPTL
jgi:hypothetical protein